MLRWNICWSHRFIKSYRINVDRWPILWNVTLSHSLQGQLLRPKSSHRRPKLCFTQSNSVRNDMRKARPGVYIRKTLYACTPYVYGTYIRLVVYVGHKTVENIRRYTVGCRVYCHMSLTEYEHYGVSVPAISASFSGTALTTSLCFIFSHCFDRRRDWLRGFGTTGRGREHTWRPEIF